MGICESKAEQKYQKETMRSSFSKNQNDQNYETTLTRKGAFSFS